MSATVQGAPPAGMRAVVRVPLSFGDGYPDVEYPDRASTESLRRLVHRLLWWAQALRTATRRVPFPA